MPKPVFGLTQQNKLALRQFNDPVVLPHSYFLPERLWAEARQGKPNRLTLAKARPRLQSRSHPTCP